jgi:hypothetical protein
MTERNKELALDIIEYSMCGLVPIDALVILCEGQEELYKYVELREDIIVGLAGLVSLFMREEFPERFEDNVHTREALIRLKDGRERLLAALDAQTDDMLALVKDKKRFKQYMDDYEASKNQA